MQLLAKFKKILYIGFRATLPLNLKLRVFLPGQSVAMVTYCVTKIIPTRSSMIGQFFDTMIVASIDATRMVIMTYQNVRLGKCWKLF